MTTKSILTLAFVFSTSPYEVFANVNCITLRSIKSTTIDDARTYVTCPSSGSYSTLVSCGGATADRLDADFDGSFIDGAVFPPRCYAQNAQNGAGVYAYARCCDFVPTDPDMGCEYTSTESWSLDTDDAYVTTHCGTDQYDTMLGCTMFTNWAYTDGSFPGSASVRPDTRSAFDTHNYPAYHHCTAQNGRGGNGVKANLACCGSPSYEMTCVTRYGSPAHPTSEVSCPSGYFMAGCSGWSLHTLNGWYIDGNKCYARTHLTTKVAYASAICCRLETDSPTTDPTKMPTRSPTSNPTVSPTKSPTAIPTVIPSQNPTTSPSNDPTQSPTLNPTLNPTRAPTNNPTQSPTLNPSSDPTQTPTNNPTQQREAGGSGAHQSDDSIFATISGLIGALVFLVLCLCGLGLFALYCLCRKRKVLKDGMKEAPNNEGFSVPIGFPIEMEGAVTTGTKRRTNGALKHNGDETCDKTPINDLDLD